MWKKNQKVSKQNFFPSDCKCQSLFTLNACNNSNPPNMNGIQIPKAKWQIFMKQINKYRQGEPVEFHKIFFDLARYLKNSYYIEYQPKKQSPKSNKSRIQANKGSSFIKPQQVPFQNGLVSCGVYRYTTPEIGKCVKKFKRQFGEPLRIYFMGESIIRNIMEEFIRQTRDELNLKIDKSFHLNIEKLLGKKIKVNVVVAGEGIEYRFYWSPFLEKNKNLNDPWQQGAKDVLEFWANNTRKYLKNSTHPMPDILYIGDGFWNANQNSNVESLDIYVNEQQILKKLLIKLSKEVQILWRFHHMVEGWAKRDPNIITALNFMNQISWTEFKHSKVWIWETLSLFTTKEKRECSYYKISKLQNFLPLSWKCYDDEHPGKIAVQYAFTAIWNLACNRILDLKQNLCCM